MSKLEKSQKRQVKKPSKRAYGSFIYAVSWWWRVINFELDNSYIYKRAKTITYKNGKTKQAIPIPKLPRWKDVTRVQEVAYFAKFLAGTKEFSNLKPFTQDFTYTRHKKYKNKNLKKIKNDYEKKVYNSLRYYGENDVEMVYVVEGKNKRINLHGCIDETRIKNQKHILKQSASTYRKEYEEINYRNMLQIKDNYDYIEGGSYGWFGYMNKGNRSENGLYLSNALKNRIREDYQNFYEQYNKIIQQLKAEGVKVVYQKDIPEEDDDMIKKTPPLV